MVIQNFHDRSRRAAFLHPVLASGCNARLPRWTGMMTDKGWGQSAVKRPLHPFPEDSALATVPRQGAMPELTDLDPKYGQRRAVHEYFAVPDVSADHRVQSRAPVNTSAPPLQTTPHDSGAVRGASPSPYISFIHYTSPGYPGVQRSKPCKQNLSLLH